MVRMLWTALLVSGAASAQEYGPTYLMDVEPGRCCTVIAHAGGAIDGNAYTNTREAMLESIAMGTRLIELDYSKTSDGRWFVTHDWGHWARQTGYKGPLPPRAKDVIGRPYQAAPSAHGVPGTYHVMSLEEADAIAEANPTTRIVTDTKESNVELVEAITSLGHPWRYVFQSYSVDEAWEIFNRQPGAQIILTIYKLPDSWREGGIADPLLQKLANDPRLMGITMPMSTAVRVDNLQRVRKVTSAPVFVHGQPGEINTRLVHWKLGRMGVSGFYLD